MDYSKISKQIESLDGTELIGEVGSLDEQYNLYKISRGKGKKVLLSGVVHGDEPAGAYAILNFFQNHIHEYENDFEFTAFPCVNPWGFQHSKRVNAENLDLNRGFKKDAAAEEVQLIMPLLEKYVFDYKIEEGKNFQVRDGIDNGCIDFLVKREFLEWHPIVVFNLGRGDSTEEDVLSIKKLREKLSKEDFKKLQEEYEQVLAINYRNRRQGIVDNSKYFGYNVALATTKEEFYDFISKYSESLPDFREFKSEFKEKVEYVKSFKVEKKAA